MRLCKLALVLGAVALLSGPVLAQGGRGGFGGFFTRPAELLRVEKVQKDIGIEKDDLEKATKALAKLREDLKDDYDKQGFRSTASDDEKAAARKKTSEAEEKTVKETVSEKQYKRLKQISHQLQGIAMFQDESVQKALKLTDDQKDKLKEINKDLDKEVAELFPRGSKPAADAFTKMQSLRKDALTSATKLLDDTQKKEIKELTGEPLELKMEDFPARGGKPGGGGGKPAKPGSDF